MDTLYLNFDRNLFSSKKEDGINKYTNLILSNASDEPITNFQKLTITIPNTEDNNSSFNIINSPKVYKNNNEEITNGERKDDNTCNHNNINTCRKMKINQVDSKKYLLPEIVNKKQKNLSFSNQKLWEINRVNQILHKKISNGIKPTYLRQNPTTFIAKATSTINREKKNKDINKGNKVSFDKNNCFIIYILFLINK